MRTKFYTAMCDFMFFKAAKLRPGAMVELMHAVGLELNLLGRLGHNKGGDSGAVCRRLGVCCILHALSLTSLIIKLEWWQSNNLLNNRYITCLSGRYGGTRNTFVRRHVKHAA